MYITQDDTPAICEGDQDISPLDVSPDTPPVITRLVNHKTVNSIPRNQWETPSRRGNVAESCKGTLIQLHCNKTVLTLLEWTDYVSEMTMSTALYIGALISIDAWSAAWSSGHCPVSNTLAILIASRIYCVFVIAVGLESRFGSTMSTVSSGSSLCCKTY